MHLKIQQFIKSGYSEGTAKIALEIIKDWCCESLSRDCWKFSIKLQVFSNQPFQEKKKKYFFILKIKNVMKIEWG